MRWRSVLVERAVVARAFFGGLAAVIARDVGDHDLLRRRHAEQVGVKNEMIRMLVVPLVADVIARVVQQRGVGQRITILLARSRGVRRASRTGCSASRCTCDECGCSTWQRTANSPTERARASPGIGDRRRDARRLEQESFTNPVARDDDLARFDAAQNLGRDRDAGDDDVGSLGIESRHRAALVGRHVGEHVENMLEIGVRNVRGVNRSRRENSLTRQVNSREVRERPARSDDLRAAPIAQRNSVADSFATPRAAVCERALA